MDPLDEQLEKFREVDLGPAPSKAEILARVHDRRKRRARIARAVAVVTVVGGSVVGLGIWRAGDDGRTSTPTRLETGVGESVPSSSPTTASAPRSVSDPAALSDALASRFPSSFGGVVTTGEASVDVFAVGDAIDLESAARQLVGDRYVVTLRPSDHTRQEILALKTRIEAERSELRQAGVPVHDLAIRIEQNGPRVLIGLSPDSAAGRAELRRRYGGDAITIMNYGDVVPQ